MREVTRIYGRLAKEKEPILSEDRKSEKEKTEAETETKVEKKGEA